MLFLSLLLSGIVSNPDQCDTAFLDSRLRGDWKPRVIMFFGETWPVSDIEVTTVKIKEDSTDIVGGKQSIGMTYKLNKDVGPTAIDLQLLGETYLGVYQVRNGSLVICWARPGEKRPTKVPSGAATGTSGLLILR